MDDGPHMAKTRWILRDDSNTFVYTRLPIFAPYYSRRTDRRVHDWLFSQAPSCQHWDPGGIDDPSIRQPARHGRKRQRDRDRCRSCERAQCGDVRCEQWESVRGIQPQRDSQKRGCPNTRWRCPEPIPGSVRINHSINLFVDKHLKYKRQKAS